MLRRLTALVFILTLAGGALAGTPLHPRDQECATAGAAVADCCEKSRQQPEAPDALAAGLCCVPCCSQPAPVSLTGGSFKSRTARSPVAFPARAAATRPASPLSPSLTPGRGLTLPLNPTRGYILHSALLI